MPIQIDPNELRIVQQILEKWIPHAEVWAFGSRVTLQSKEFSDLDLVILDEKPISISVLAQLKEEFSESDLPFKVDVTRWSEISVSFRKIIEARYEVVQPTDSHG